MCIFAEFLLLGVGARFPILRSCLKFLEGNFFTKLPPNMDRVKRNSPMRRIPITPYGFLKNGHFDDFHKNRIKMTHSPHTKTMHRWSKNLGMLFFCHSRTLCPIRAKSKLWLPQSAYLINEKKTTPIKTHSFSLVSETPYWIWKFMYFVATTQLGSRRIHSTYFLRNRKYTQSYGLLARYDDYKKFSLSYGITVTPFYRFNTDEKDLI